MKREHKVSMKAIMGGWNWTCSHGTAGYIPFREVASLSREKRAKRAAQACDRLLYVHQKS